MSKYFERQLEELHVQLITLGSYCEKAISFSAKAIQKVQNEEIARQVFETDRDIDAKEREIENLCLSLLLHQHPFFIFDLTPFGINTFCFLFQVYINP